MNETTKATEKQLKLIDFIVSETGIEFSGSTKAEASKFISEYIDEAKLLSKSYDALMEGEWS